MMEESYKIESIYVSCAINRSDDCMDWGKNGLICYGTGNAVALCDASNAVGKKILSTSSHHRGCINSVSWVKKSDGSVEDELITTSSDKTARVWELRNNFLYPSAILSGHEDVLTFADGLYMPGGHQTSQKAMIIATASIDSTIKLWLRDKKVDFEFIQNLYFGDELCFDVKLTFLPETTNVLIVCGASDCMVHVFAKTDDEYSEIQRLKGHKNWIRSLDVATDDSGDVLIASGSQDSTIRLWRISSHKLINELPANEDIELKDIFTVGKNNFAVILEAVLTSDGWIRGVSWHPPMFSLNGTRHQPMKLLSTSLEKSMIIWTPEASTGVWLESACFGDVSGTMLGYESCRFGPDGLSIVGQGHQGTFHFWSWDSNKASWEPSIPVGGHSYEVMDARWEPEGQFIMSIGQDKTARIHAPWFQPGKKHVTWHEVGRPQIHGHILSCFAMISRHQFVSGAEEKVIRAFKAPSNFIENLKRLSNVDLAGKGEGDAERACGASMPALGLSNKAVFTDEVLPENRHVKDEFPASHFKAIDLRAPPTEEHLAQSTLWPEIQKLYGHVFEIFSLAAHPSGKWFASSCKAAKYEDAGILIWDTIKWQIVQTLLSHSLTVTQMAFSPDGKYLVSVSRDRCWSLFKQTETDTFRPIASTTKENGIHLRVIWCCAWTPDSQYFATGSRDGKVVIWHAEEGVSKISSHDLFGESVTALAFAPSIEDDKYMLAMGFECGIIKLCNWSKRTRTWENVMQLNKSKAHHMTVSRLDFHPTDKTMLLSCGHDYAVKIHKLVIVHEKKIVDDMKTASGC